MSRRGAGAAPLKPTEIQLVETPALGSIVGDAARALMRAGARPPEVASLMCHAAARLAQQGQNRLTRDEWLALCAVLWDGPDGEELVTAPGGQA